MPILQHQLLTQLVLDRHWRYISSFHGPWLQLPPEVLESLAYSNYLAPRPHPIDPAVFFDLVKIRKAVDEATNLAVRAASGVTSSALHSSMNASNGMLHSNSAAALGLGFGGNTGAKLSRERQHRMRELATQKLSHAYHLDEIAASVATMQSASTLEDLAQLVLRRNAQDYDARYVHFFHEKIPSRMMAQCTPLDPLNKIISERPSDGSPFRTRALTRIFKEDFLGAAKDLTEGLSIAKWLISQHRAGRDQLVLARDVREEAQNRYGRDWKQEVRLPEEDQPSSLETQMLFHRAGVYLTIACQHVHAALDAMHEAAWYKSQANSIANGMTEPPEQRVPDPAEQEAHRRHLEHRKMVKTNAKRALRDYNGFLSHFDYTPGLAPEIAEEFVRQINNLTNGRSKTQRAPSWKQIVELPDDNTSPEGLSDALIPVRKSSSSDSSPKRDWPSLPPPEVYKVSELFSATPPANIPVYPPDTSNAITLRSGPTAAQTASSSAAAAALADSHEAITYHPLITDALHSLLLCHSLLQTTCTELRRHAHNAARLARICDGYPIFLAARSPARADWVEVLRRAHNWIGLTQSWEALCRPAPLPGHGTQGLGDRGWDLERRGRDAPQKSKEDTEKEKRERRKQEAIMEALADERVVDEESFQRAVRAREKRAIEDEEAAEAAAKGEPPKPKPAPTPSSSTNGAPAKQSFAKDKKPEPPKRWAQDEGKDYPISTERAEAISRWVREAPLTVEGAKKKAGRKGKAKKSAPSLSQSEQKLELQDDDRVEEEIDE
jgi:hypothetical protein